MPTTNEIIIQIGNSGTVGVGEVELAGMVSVCGLLQLLFLLIKFSGKFTYEDITGGNQPPIIALTLKSN